MVSSKEFPEVMIIIYHKPFPIEICIGTETFKIEPEEPNIINIDYKNSKSIQSMKVVKELLIDLLNKFYKKSPDYLW